MKAPGVIRVQLDLDCCLSPWIQLKEYKNLALAEITKKEAIVWTAFTAAFLSSKLTVGPTVFLL